METERIVLMLQEVLMPYHTYTATRKGHRATVLRVAKPYLHSNVMNTSPLALQIQMVYNTAFFNTAGLCPCRSPEQLFFKAQLKARISMKRVDVKSECNQKFPRLRDRSQVNDSRHPDVQWRARIASP